MLHKTGSQQLTFKKIQITGRKICLHEHHSKLGFMTGALVLPWK